MQAEPNLIVQNIATTAPGKSEVTLKPKYGYLVPLGEVSSLYPPRIFVSQRHLNPSTLDCSPSRFLSSPFVIRVPFFLPQTKKGKRVLLRNLAIQGSAGLQFERRPAVRYPVCPFEMDFLIHEGW